MLGALEPGLKIMVKDKAHCVIILLLENTCEQNGLIAKNVQAYNKYNKVVWAIFLA